MNWLLGKNKEQSHPLANFKKEMDSLFENFWKSPLDWPGEGSLFKADFSPKLDIKETDSEVKISAELPGMTEKDVEVSLDNNVLTIKGEKKHEEEKKEGEYHYTERSYGSFYRSIPMPESIVSEKAQATFNKGILTLSIPKNKEQEAKKRIEIKTS